MMKMNKEKFLKTEFGAELKNCIQCWDLYLIEKNYQNARFCQEQWDVYQMAVKQFYGIEYHFTRTKEYFGVVTEDCENWLFKIERSVDMKKIQRKKTYTFKIRLCDGYYAQGSYSVEANSEEEAENIVAQEIGQKLYQALPELGIDYTWELIN